MGVVDLVDAPGLAYLASPYSHNDPAVRHARFKEAERAWAWLQRNQVYTISPVVMCHEVARNQKLPYDHLFWAPLNSRLFFSCKRLVVLCIDGWRDSHGIAAEMKWADAMKMPIYAMTEVELDYAINRI